MPLDECSAAMSFQVGFKSVGFFSVFECYCVFDPPRFVFCSMRNIAFIVLFKAGFQVFGTADVEMGSGCFINENVNVVEVGHQRKSFRIMFEVVLCRIARLHLLCRLRRGSLPRCRLRASHFAPPSGFARQSICCATGLPRRNLGFAEMKTGGQ